jgi:hypothetical protein
MDIFIEELVQKKKDAKDWLIIAWVIFGAIILSMILVWLMLAMRLSAMNAVEQGQQAGIGSMFSSFGVFFIAAVWYAAYRIINTRSIEYEYIVTNSVIDIDKVMSKKRRKHLVSIDIHSATKMARIDDNDENSVFKNPPQGVKVLNYSAMSRNGYTYFIDCMADDKRAIVLLQPSSKIVESLWKYNPRAVKKYTD